MEKVYTKNNIPGTLALVDSQIKVSFIINQNFISWRHRIKNEDSLNLKYSIFFNSKCILLENKNKVGIICKLKGHWYGKLSIILCYHTISCK